MRERWRRLPVLPTCPNVSSAYASGTPGRGPAAWVPQLAPGIRFGMIGFKTISSSGPIGSVIDLS